ncbi:hypothetical protein J4558_16585 [Leptolyngbya sp. 15MV]|nr:hypothetical protein J4558_16585 [Leptolyngbya sp. 15MV]
MSTTPPWLGPGDLVDNSEITEGSYRPRNARGNYSASLTLEDAFARSSNVAAVRLLQTVGSEAVIDAARDLGVRSPLAEGDPSLALGTSTTTLMELTAAYAGLAANEFPVVPRAFREERPSWFERLWDGKSSLSRRTHADMEQLLRSAINRGTGRAAMLRGPNFGKTGTTQDYRDALFIGYAGDLVVGVWIGNDDNTPLSGIGGGDLPARIWRDFMAQALGERQAPPRPTPRPDPSGPVEPLDVPDLRDVPLGDSRSRLSLERDSVTISTEVGGVPLDLRVGQDGLVIEPRAPPE